ncbi:Storkhead-box protein 1 [Orchesella cincta]|uniref:Storkhead-box protein 1 n=1 Tax=Orchesella cincta TaxID=48709 RepID=A0A1D2M8U5_ORCCI|nr:Storkhead-box protein 1 [Orchesella cincta]
MVKTRRRRPAIQATVTATKEILLQCFVEANQKCHWNTRMIEAINSLEYSGHVVPTTILVRSSANHLNVLRTAWARRTIRSPVGFRIQLLGMISTACYSLPYSCVCAYTNAIATLKTWCEVEELVAQPIQQGQFSPLSDSICWSIHSLTSSGEEAFVDSIIRSLSSAFPSMCIPPKELVYATLEKLIREQKIYQTPSGYYIVTPEVCVFMNSRSSTPAYSSSWCLNEKRGCYGSAACLNENEDRWTRKLTRHSSMRIIRKPEYAPRPHMGARSLSFRLSKCNSLFDSDKELSDEEPVVETSTQTDEISDTNKRKKRWFSRRWFSFRRLIRKQPEIHNIPPDACYTDSSSGYSSESPRRLARCSSPASSVSAIYASIGNRTASFSQQIVPVNKFDKFGDIEQIACRLSSD